MQRRRHRARRVWCGRYDPSQQPHRGGRAGRKVGRGATSCHLPRGAVGPARPPLQLSVAIGWVLHSLKPPEEQHSTHVPLPHKSLLRGRFACTVAGCGKTFSLRTNLRRHLLSHASVNRHLCPHCDRAFCRADEFAAHLRGHGLGAGAMRGAAAGADAGTAAVADNGTSSRDGGTAAPGGGGRSGADGGAVDCTAAGGMGALHAVRIVERAVTGVGFFVAPARDGASAQVRVGVGSLLLRALPDPVSAGPCIFV